MAAVSDRRTGPPSPTRGSPHASSASLHPPSGPTRTRGRPRSMGEPPRSAITAPPRSATSENRVGSCTVGNHALRHCITASRATRRKRSALRAALSVSHRTTDRSAVKSRMSSIPSSTSFWTTNSGLPPLIRANPTPRRGDGEVAVNTSLTGSGSTDQTHDRHRPAPSPTVSGSPARSRRTLSRWCRSSSPKRGS